MTHATTKKTDVAPDHIPHWDDPSELIFHRVEIDLDKCDGCKLCTVVCPADVLELFGPKDNLKCRVKDDHFGCLSCNNCEAICASNAIRADKPYDFAGYYEQKRIGAFSSPRKF